MRYVFIINPIAGGKGHNKRYLDILKQKLVNTSLDYQIYISEDAQAIYNIALTEAKSLKPLRIYVVGGDGSICELVNAIQDYSNVEIGVFPKGSGNDFVRNFPEANFFNLDKQLFSKSIPINLIETNTKACLNLASIGFDACVCFNTVQFKKIPFSTNSMRYNLAILKTLITNFGNEVKLKLHSDGKIKTYEGNYLFVLAANGISYGGGFKAAPLAKVNDDYLDLVLIKKPSLFTLMRLIKDYKNGKHLNNPKFDKYLVYLQGQRLEFSSKEALYCNLDGECFKTYEGYFALSHKKIKFIVPNN